MKINIYQIRILALTIMVLGLFTSQVYSAIPVVTNVTASQRPDTKLVDISYDLADADGDKCAVWFKLSSDGGERYLIPTVTSSGDVGVDISPGNGKKIVWNAGEDWDGEFSEEMKVKVIARDLKGIPGLEFSNEIKAGGFLMGIAGSPESKRVNIPHSYWLSKYEITRGQYCDFLNVLQASKNTEVRHMNNDTENPIAVHILEDKWNNNRPLAVLGVNNIQYVSGLFSARGYENYPVEVTNFGATEFARFYGYGIPTEAEWEKAARGPDNDDFANQSWYPWAKSIYVDYRWPGEGLAVGGSFPVGQAARNNRQKNTVNGYGMYDVIGNVREWTSSGYRYIKEYPKIDVPDDVVEGGSVRRGGAYSDYNPSNNNQQLFNEVINNMLSGRKHYTPKNWEATGFRVIRRNLP